jgi:hypothetical protein
MSTTGQIVPVRAVRHVIPNLDAGPGVDQQTGRERSVGTLGALDAAGRVADEATISRAKPPVVHVMCDLGCGRLRTRRRAPAGPDASSPNWAWTPSDPTTGAFGPGCVVPNLGLDAFGPDDGRLRARMRRPRSGALGASGPARAPLAPARAPRAPQAPLRAPPVPVLRPELPAFGSQLPRPREGCRHACCLRARPHVAQRREPRPQEDCRHARLAAPPTASRLDEDDARPATPIRPTHDTHRPTPATRRGRRPARGTHRPMPIRPTRTTPIARQPRPDSRGPTAAARQPRPDSRGPTAAARYPRPTIRPDGRDRRPGLGTPGIWA